MTQLAGPQMDGLLPAGPALGHTVDSTAGQHQRNTDRLVMRCIIHHVVGVQQLLQGPNMQHNNRAMNGMLCDRSCWLQDRDLRQGVAANN